MNNVETLKMILQMYKFTEPVPDRVKLMMVKSRRKNLVFILKKFGKYGFFTMIAVWLFFMLKKAGITVSIAKTYVIATAVSAATAGTVVFTSAAVVKRQFFTAKADAISSPAETAAPERTPLAEESAAPVIRYALEIQPFSSQSEYEEQSRKLAGRIYSRLNTGGRNVMMLSSSSHNANAPFRLAGSIVKLGDTFTATVRMIDSSDSRVILNISEKWDKDEDLNSIGDRIAEAVSAKIR